MKNIKNSLNMGKKILSKAYKRSLLMQNKTKYTAISTKLNYIFLYVLMLFSKIVKICLTELL